MLIFSFLLFINIHVFCQNEALKPEKTAAITIGFLQGGGSLVGVDFEKMLNNHFSF